MTKELNHWDQRIKTLMEQVGHPDSMSLYQAFKQLQNELTQRPQAVPMTDERRREDFMAGYAAAEQDAAVCQVPPFGWRCTREAGHEGPCAAVETDDAELVQRGMDRLREAHHGINQRADGGEVDRG